jgi:hypothetical protein
MLVFSRTVEIEASSKDNPAYQERRECTDPEPHDCLQRTLRYYVMSGGVWLGC